MWPSSMKRRWVNRHCCPKSECGECENRTSPCSCAALTLACHAPIVRPTHSALDRARVRYTIERFSQLVTPHWGSALRQRSVSSLSSLLSALLSFQSLLPPSTTSSGTGGGPYFFGSRYSLVEVCVAPFLGRIITLSNAGLLPGGEEGRAVAKTLLEDPKYERLAAYWNAISNRPSWKNTFDEGAIVSQFGQRVKGWEEAAAETKPKQ